MAVVKNKTTQENLEFWAHCAKVAEEVKHWPKWMGGEGKPKKEFTSSEFGKQIGLMYDAQVIQGDDGDFFVVPQASTRLSRHKLEDLVNMLKTLESINVVY